MTISRLSPMHLIALMVAMLVIGCVSDSTPDLSTAFPTAPSTVPSTASPSISGTYQLYAPIIGFDPAWGDFTDYYYSAVVTFSASSPWTSGRVGAFTDFRVTAPGDTSEHWMRSGSINSFVSVKGKPAFELVADYFHWTAVIDSIVKPEGDAAGSPMIKGTFGMGGHITGAFTATRIQRE